jgi:hypothetical protein
MTTNKLSLSGMTAWALSFPLLLLTTLTPLCLGQDNGDGRNRITMCVFLAVVCFIVMSLPVCGCLLLLATWASTHAAAGDQSRTARSQEKHDCQASPPPPPRAPQAGHSAGEG